MDWNVAFPWRSPREISRFACNKENHLPSSTVRDSFRLNTIESFVPSENGNLPYLERNEREKL